MIARFVRLHRSGFACLRKNLVTYRCKTNTTAATTNEVIAAVIIIGLLPVVYRRPTHKKRAPQLEVPSIFFMLTKTYFTEIFAALLPTCTTYVPAATENLATLFSEGVAALRSEP